MSQPKTRSYRITPDTPTICQIRDSATKNYETGKDHRMNSSVRDLGSLEGHALARKLIIAAFFIHSLLTALSFVFFVPCIFLAL